MNIFDNIAVTEIINTITVFSEKGRNEQMYLRKYYGLSFCLSGQITYLQGGRKYISNSGCAVILPKGQSYTIRGDRDGLFPVINFECADFLCDKIIVIPIKKLSTYTEKFEQIKNLLLFEKNRLKAMSVFYDILHRLVSGDEEKESILSPAIKYLENNYASLEITNACLASQCNISEVYFRKLFMKTYGMTPKQFIIDMRINKAKQLLTDGALKIKAVSEECGFSNQYHFSRLFKQKTGMTPSSFMKQNRVYKI